MRSVLSIRSALRFYAAHRALSITRQAPHALSVGSIGALALVVVPAIVGAFCSVVAQTESSQEKEISRVESWFKGTSLAEISSTLARSRPEPVSQSDKALLMKNLLLLNTSNRIEDESEISRLHVRLEKTLKFFERAQVVELVIFRHSQPIVYSKPGVVIVISTEVLKIVGGDDDALVGVIAHELAHEHVALEYLAALKSGNHSRMRELELFCDGVAVVVVLELGFDPAKYARALKIIANHSQASAELNNGGSSHPSLDARLRVISAISAALINRPVHPK